MTDPSPSNSAADIPDDFKTPLARLYKHLHANNVSRALFLEGLTFAGFSVSSRQLDRWVDRIESAGSAIKENKATGAIPLLNREQRDVASGWVLHENERGVAVKLATFHDFVLEHFSVELSNATISKYLEEDGFTSRVGQKKGTSFLVDVEALRKELWDWVIIQDFRGRGINRSKFASIDFTFTGHRTERNTTFAPKGGAQPMLPEKISKFTNCIVTCVWSNGANKTPSIVFTYNSLFREDRNMTAKRKRDVTYLHELMDKYHISKERIIYIGSDKNETRKYVRECPDLLRRFFSVYGVPPECTIYSDEGNAFFEDSTSVLLKLGFANHRRYPNKVHQYASVNDNRLHGTSKQSWRNCGVDFSDDVASSLALLSFLDRDTVKHSKYWWDRNMILLKEEGVKELIGQGPCKLSHLHKSWKRRYKEFMNQNKE